MYQGQSIQLREAQQGIVELIFDRQDEAINKFDRRTLDELGHVASLLAERTELRGLLVSSAKEAFIVGADITEFGQHFRAGEDELSAWLRNVNAIFSAIEDLPFPTVCAINGYALGGGFEMALSTDFRVMAKDARIGFPEVRLGIIPGFGGTVRMPRLTGADHAIEWIASGKEHKAADALKIHVVDAVVGAEVLRDSALRMLAMADSGALDWRARRAQKKGRLGLSQIESMMVFETAKAYVAGQSGPHLPAPLRAVTAMQKAATKTRDEALEIEAQNFVKMAHTVTADALVTVFLNDQAVKRRAKAWSRQRTNPVRQAAVLGAGIMGGGIAYQSAARSVPILMKDISEAALTLGMNEASKLFAKEVERGKLGVADAGQALSRIRPTLQYGDLSQVDIVVEAVVENPKVKKGVLAEVESLLPEQAILASNTSSISIDDLASSLKRPQNFLGMHFFNPVHRMPLVEVIRGTSTSDAAIATVVAYASAMGKTPIVVRDCPGFLVNRILFPYFYGFEALVRDGADFASIDRVMESFGWPMGPAYLLDVVGIDTSHHVGDVLGAGYPDRMAKTATTAVDVLYAVRRLGQKSGAGFYRYETDPKGKPKKIADPEAYELLKAIQPNGARTFTEGEIVDRMMLPMLIEAARCLEEGIVESAAEADMGLLMGLGFPPHFGGAFKYADILGLAEVVTKADALAHLGKAYSVTARMRDMAAAGQRYYGG